MSRKLPGLRAAMFTYVLVVVLGLGAAGAHALWSQSGTVAVAVTAGTWAPAGTVDANTVTCSNRADEGWDAQVTVMWEAVDATGYRLSTTPESFMDINPLDVVPTGPGHSVSQILTFKRPSMSGFGNFTLSITPMLDGKPGTATKIAVELDHKHVGSLSCKPLD
ncbi:hypothetical protein GCM10009715_18480 [Paeniglutamicibacter psychrophenolicus]|uniref:Ribosomally synthesized peptide with SipW-like signal peptide n=1 Tax=Paeniglutamicibacter psychrophenolicus TaxID=257454 RepID=A0ABS4WEV2_9MICC|nr:SipW-dependent-type signal peptide-containing protein [Paeniglutamicibacter psychrophenolicus]MBP2374094.1 putative ribosomally synthesized peptide with SipW-like signal peptide [Paeniglutamicibacter psychrophenolicus]